MVRLLQILMNKLPLYHLGGSIYSSYAIFTYRGINILLFSQCNWQINSYRRQIRVGLNQSVKGVDTI